MTTVVDKIRGAVMGGALGDSIGLYTEFMSSAEARRCYGDAPRFSHIPDDSEVVRPRHRDNHRNNFARAAWTDDTDQALLILLGYLRSDGQLSSYDFAKRLTDWIDHGLVCLGTPSNDVGITTRAVASDPGYLENESAPVQVAYQHWHAGGCRNAANGAVMRTWTLGPALYAATEDLSSAEREAFVSARASEYAATTHADPRCLISSIIVTSLVLALLRSEISGVKDLDDYLERVVASFCSGSTNRPPLDLAELRRHTHASSLADLKLDDSPAIGYTYKTLGAGIELLRHALSDASATFEELITELTMAGGDADTNAAVAGALLGAHYGFDALPKHWTDGLCNGSWLIKKVDALCSLSRLVSVAYDPDSDPDTLPPSL